MLPFSEAKMIFKQMDDSFTNIVREMLTKLKTHYKNISIQIYWKFYHQNFKIFW